MAVKTAVVDDVVQYRNAAGKTRNAIVIAVQPAAPASGDFTVANSGTGGTLTAATYSYRITTVTKGVEGPAVAAKTTVVGGGTTNKCTITFPNATATSVYGVYGRVGGSELFMAYVTPGVAGTWDDTGAITPAGAAPTADGRVGLFNATGGLKTGTGGQAGVTALKATTVASVDAYFKY
jgi:hypothetical protein